MSAAVQERLSALPYYRAGVVVLAEGSRRGPTVMVQRMMVLGRLHGGGVVVVHGVAEQQVPVSVEDHAIVVA